MIRSKLAREKAINLLAMYSATEPPIDINDIAEKLGFVVVPFDFPDSVSAVLRINGDSKVIGVNQNHAHVRQRFSVAHELGHYLSGHENYTHEKQIIVDPDKKYLDPQYRMEQEADEFAAEILMPQPLLRKDVIEKRMAIKDLRERYQVSEQALWIQLINHRLATEFSQ